MINESISVGIAGTGRVGQAIGLIAVPDTAVETDAARLARSGFRHGVALHTCGAAAVMAGTDKSLSLGPVKALTGPIERGESKTVIAHLNGLRNLPEPLSRVYRSIGELVVQMAVLRGLHEARAAEIEAMLKAVQ
jgi:predicted short-subunit dehydrogenase-like oxidoreductase (DUF2520 family)